MFYQCNWTAWLQRAVLRRLSDRYIVPNAISSLPLINFPLSLNILFPCMLSFLTVLRSLLCPTPCPCFFLYCALPLFLLAPVLSSHGWCVGCAAGGQVMHCRSWGYENISAGRKVHKANMHRKNTCLQKLWHPPRPTSSVSSKYQISSLRRTSRQV